MSKQNASPEAGVEGQKGPSKFRAGVKRAKSWILRTFAATAGCSSCRPCGMDVDSPELYVLEWGAGRLRAEAFQEGVDFQDVGR